MTRTIITPRPRNRFGRGALIAGSLAAAFVAALTVPIPTLPDAGRAEVREEVAARLPGWSVERLVPSWENSYSVVTSCGGRELSFGFVPGHGLPRDDAWIQPHNTYARARMAATSDHARYLLWRGDKRNPSSMTCTENLAQRGSSESRGLGTD
jgi:hypothetical protein